MYWKNIRWFSLRAGGADCEKNLTLRYKKT
jgi:hypothetical protein